MWTTRSIKNVASKYSLASLSMLSHQQNIKMNYPKVIRAKCALLVLCGLPGSGKTTLVAKVRELVAQNNGGLVPSGPPCIVEVITFDDWLHSALLTTGGFSADAWQRSRQAALNQLRNLLTKSSTSDEGDSQYTLLIADDNHHLRSMRYELFRTARDHGAAFLQLYFPCCPWEALKRNQRRSGIAVVPAEAVLRMAEVLEAPQPERFSWEANSLAIQIAGCEGTGESGGDGDTPDRGCRRSIVAGGDINSGIDMGNAGDDNNKSGENAAEATCLKRDNGWQCHGAVSGETDCTKPGPSPHPGSQRAHSPESSPLLPQQTQLQPQLHIQSHQVSKDQEKAGLQNAHPGVQVQAGDITALCAALWRLWGPTPPTPPREEDLLRRREEGRAANTASILHSLDLRSRRVLGAAVAAAAPAERAAVARALNGLRRVLLQTAREVLQLLPLQNLVYESEGCCRCGADGDDCAGGDGGGGRWEAVAVAVAEAEGEGHVLRRLQELEGEFVRAAGQGDDSRAPTVSGEHSPGSVSDTSSKGKV
ncbi:hypothetical protein VaNZ11_004690 [Volvox africanus]|uniref:AAA+ ATPase domain-containing protein n=1 Tax=Volvox africanus TaxID=51714 RepID=A0ABQ5RYH7_9CHLO|nr:hypothetical protein VaNZ11_004690 [Volvox africanus]